jgi:hypothetical protein
VHEVVPALELQEHRIRTGKLSHVHTFWLAGQIRGLADDDS